AITHVAVLENKRIKSVKPLIEFHSDRNSRNFDKAMPSPELPDLTSSIPLYDFKIIAGLYNIKIRYGNKLILDDVTWQIKQGERWALLGPNGAGKTTLLSLINGDNPQAYANNIVLFDKKRGSGESIWEIKEKIGFMSPELYQYFPSNFTCITIVESGFYDSIGLYRKSDPNKASVSLQWMQLIGIQQYAEELFRMVPASIQRLCLLLRALVKYPPLLLLDEPCQGLDSHQKEYIKLLVNKICENNNTTLVYVTHYREEIPSCVKKVLNLKEGKIVY
ncbi:MAG: ATP-binding cassette domain-containing protein, partial [Bacteroidota bacterium]|nr:ATP-binding cassette domain-containing protein [Bacteroidota bacterium]